MWGDTNNTLVTVVIPTWNGRHLLERCLHALNQQTFPDFTVVVVDNGSTDDTGDWVRKTHPHVRLVLLQKNQGFAAATNAGIRLTRSPLIVTLNNDTIPAPTFLAHLVAASEHFREVGMFAATLTLPTSPPRVDAAGITVNRLGVAKNTEHRQPLTDLPQQPRLVFGPCAGAALYRRALFEDIGFFDEAYFAYLEDVELAWRARWAGWTCLWVPDAVVQHEHSATGKRNLPFKFWLLGRNRLWTIRRHYPRPYLYIYAPLILFHELLTSLGATLLLRHPAPLAGRLAALRSSPPPISPWPCRITPSEMFNLLAPSQSSNRSTSS